MTQSGKQGKASGKQARLSTAGGVLEIVGACEDFPQYAYGVLQAANLAAQLRLPAITAAELGVAGGNGLVALEWLVSVISADVGVAIQQVGFDLGSGMPSPVDYRDAPYAWQEGFFAMDEPLLRAMLSTAELVIGDIAETGVEYMHTDAPPLGFLSFDLDYYSSTVTAMSALLDHDIEKYLPRVFCYFDDTVGPHEELHCEFTGELLAIREFNETHAKRKIARINGLRYKLLPLEGSWIEGMYVLHIFDHPQYNEYVFPQRNRQFPLTGARRR